MPFNRDDVWRNKFAVKVDWKSLPRIIGGLSNRTVNHSISVSGGAKRSFPLLRGAQFFSLKEVNYLLRVLSRLHLVNKTSKLDALGRNINFSSRCHRRAMETWHHRKPQCWQGALSFRLGCSPSMLAGIGMLARFYRNCSCKKECMKEKLDSKQLKHTFTVLMSGRVQ